MNARLLSTNGELSLDGRALLYWLRLSPKEKAFGAPPVHAARRFLSSWTGAKARSRNPQLHRALESRTEELIEECRRMLEEKT